MVSFTVTLAALTAAAASVASAGCSSGHSHRRHHAKLAKSIQASGSASVASPDAVQLAHKSGSAQAWASSSTVSTSAATASATSIATAWDDSYTQSDGTFPGVSRNGIGIGFLPDYQDQTISQIDQGLGIKSSFLGWYAQLPQSGEWDGSQLLSIIDQVKASGAIFQPAIMPNKYNWDGLTSGDDYQAQAIARVLKQFTDQGIEVWCRFAHEVNWYQTDGTYSGGVAEFKRSWAAVAAAVKDNDKIKMWYTPNVAAEIEQYERYFPDDKSTVDIIGIDYYPRSSSESFLEHVKPWYDMHCQDGSMLFAMAETGTMWNADINQKLAWLDQLTSQEAAQQMPYYVGASIFNYDKEQAFKLWKSGSTYDNDVAKAWFSSGTAATNQVMNFVKLAKSSS